jgi:hypothetical protein
LAAVFTLVFAAVFVLAFVAALAVFPVVAFAPALTAALTAARVAAFAATLVLTRVGLAPFNRDCAAVARLVFAALEITDFAREGFAAARDASPFEAKAPPRF